MNILFHLLVGIVGYVIFNDIQFLVGSIIIDFPLIYNEFKIRINKKTFNDNEVDKVSKIMYRITHSSFILIPLIFINPFLTLGVAVHQLIDYFSHKNLFSAIPFYPFKFLKVTPVKRKKVLLLSGGYDSVSCFYMINKKDYDYYFFDYGQSYIKQELKAVKYLAEKENIKINIIKKKWKTDIKNRNFMLISCLQELGYDNIMIGTRNILPVFDKYKDSNWLSLKIYGLINRIKIEMPLIGLFKNNIISRIPKNILPKMYTTEK